MAGALSDWGISGSPAEDAVVDDLLLVATELLSNAVKFSSGSVSLALSRKGRNLRVSVTDTAPAPATQRASGPDASGGRGLAIVAALSRRWGQTPFADGRKEVWAEVIITPGSGVGTSRGTFTTAMVEG